MEGPHNYSVDPRGVNKMFWPIIVFLGHFFQGPASEDWVSAVRPCYLVRASESFLPNNSFIFIFTCIFLPMLLLL